MPSKWRNADEVAQDELQKLGKAQQRLLPKKMPEVCGFQTYFAFRPAFIATGDYYDFFQRTDGTTSVFIGDGSGHGPSACMLMATMRALMRTHPDLHGSPGDTLRDFGVMLRDLIPSDMFMTGLYLVFESENTISWASAGQYPPVRQKENGIIRLPEMDIGDIPLGIHVDDPVQYQSVTRELEPGERVLLFTDGFYEALNLFGEKLGSVRLHQYLLDTRHMPLDEMVEWMVDAAVNWTHDAEFEDDFTIIGIERRKE